MAQQIMLAYQQRTPIPTGQQLWESNTTWTVPADVTAISVVAVGAGGDASNGKDYTNGGVTRSQGGIGGNGGNLAYSNGITVTPGESLTIVVGPNGSTQGGNNPTGTNGNDGGDSGIKRGDTWLIKAQGGTGGQYGTTGASNTSNGTGDSVGDVIRQGGVGRGYAGRQNSGRCVSGGGGAAGYSGNGGNAGLTVGHSVAATGWALRLTPTNGSGGGGGGGCPYGAGSSPFAGGGGGGVGLMGEGTSGSAGVQGNASNNGYNTDGETAKGEGGSGGDDGAKSQGGDNGGYGGKYGGGAGGPALTSRIIWGRGTQGGVRAIYGSSPARAFPSTNTGNL